MKRDLVALMKRGLAVLGKRGLAALATRGLGLVARGLAGQLTRSPRVLCPQKLPDLGDKGLTRVGVKILQWFRLGNELTKRFNEIKLSFLSVKLIYIFYIWDQTSIYKSKDKTIYINYCHIMQL